MNQTLAPLIPGPLRVALYINTVAFAGTERHILDLAGGLKAQGVEAAIFCPATSPLVAKAQEQGLLVVTIPQNGAGAVRSLCRSLIEGYSLLHVHNGQTALQGALAVRLARRGRCVMTQHFVSPAHVTYTGLKAALFGRAHHWVNQQITRFIAISEAVRAPMLTRGEASPDKITVVPNGLSCDPVPLEKAAAMRAEFGIALDAPLLVCVARLEKEKDVSGLLAAFREVRERVPEARALVVGEGSQRQSLEAAAQTLGIADAVQFTGFREDARTAIAAADVFVLPSPAEPFGLVLLEAMALGKAVVAIEAGGPREIVIAGETGILVPPADSAALAEALGRLLSSPEERQRMGDAGKRRYEDCFTTQQMAQRTQAVYAQAVGA
jgi:glycosyltransferase involved in cell wall biosynthesis